MLALILTIVMVLSLCTVAFAADTTTEPVTPALPTDKDGNPTSTIAAAPAGIASIKVNGDTAVYHTDSNGVTYIRAIDNPDSEGKGGTEWALRNATVEIARSSAVQLTVDGRQLGAASATTLTLKMNMFNTAHALVIDGVSYVLAAGLPSGAVAIDDEDSLRMTAITVNGARGFISATCTQNPYIGNASASNGKWTYINYKVDASMSSAPASRAAVPATISLPDGTTAPTSNSCLNADGTLKLDGALSKLRIRNGTTDRFYYIFATDSTRFNVTFGIDFTEAKASTEYENDSDVRDAVDLLESYAIDYFGGNSGLSYGTISVDSGDTVMDIMRDFAVANDLGDEVPEGCTYMATLNGIGEFTFGQMSGWMYTNTPYRDNAGNALFTSWFTPPIGAADYTLSEGDNICWFICTNYVHHPWQ